MPKNTNADVLRRWMALDAALASAAGLHLPSCARAHGASERTVRRDLETLGTFRQLIRLVVEGKAADRPWHYAAGERPLFTDTPRRPPPRPSLPE
jgi:hypothetical protein